jgi:hypothetical protein
MAATVVPAALSAWKVPLLASGAAEGALAAVVSAMIFGGRVGAPGTLTVRDNLGQSKQARKRQ